MSMDDHGSPDSQPQRKAPGDKKTRNSYLAVGIVFTAVGIGLSFGDSSAWIVFLILGVTFLGVSATPMAKKRGAGRKLPPTD